MILLFCFVTPPGLEPGSYLPERYVLSTGRWGLIVTPPGFEPGLQL